MARLMPFTAYRYDPARVQPRDVVTQPYDKITPAMRERYLARSPYNLVRIILGESQPGDGEGDNVYTRARDYLATWIRDGILRRDTEPGVYPYTQTFDAPEGGGRQTRRGFIALCHLEDYANRIVYRHEQTLSGPKADRQALLRATHAHFGQLFMMYSDPTQKVEAELQDRATNPVAEATDEYGTVHRLFREADASVIERLCNGMAPIPLVIADGHHRYETALQWRDEQRARAPHLADAPWDWVMMTFVNLDAPGLVVLPTHRLVHGLAAFSAADARRRLGEWFELAEQPAAGDDATAWAALRDALAKDHAAGQISLGAWLAGESAPLRLRLRSGVALDRELPDALPEQRRLDVLLLHSLALERALGISPEAVREQRNLRYERDGVEAVKAVRSGSAQAAFFLHPIPPQQVRDVALAGGVMPQKSTDFFPKMLSGLTIYKVE